MKKTSRQKKIEDASTYAPSPEAVQFVLEQTEELRALQDAHQAIEGEYEVLRAPSNIARLALLEAAEQRYQEGHEALLNAYTQQLGEINDDYTKQLYPLQERLDRSRTQINERWQQFLGSPQIQEFIAAGLFVVASGVSESGAEALFPTAGELPSAARRGADVPADSASEPRDRVAFYDNSGGQIGRIDIPGSNGLITRPRSLLQPRGDG